MNATIEDIATALKAARKVKGWTQKELGERVGIPQSHISKIEKGLVDVKLSSLVEIARALDLEVKLLPRQILPIVESSLRAHDAASDTRSAANLLSREAALARELNQQYPDIDDIAKYRQILNNLAHLQLGPIGLRELEHALQPTRQIKAILNAGDETAALVKRLRESTTALQSLRNRLAHQPLPQAAKPRPAYRLDDEDSE